MINEILCFMWGHFYKLDVDLSTYRKPGLVFLYRAKLILQCKHCGARK